MQNIEIRTLWHPGEDSAIERAIRLNHKKRVREEVSAQLRKSAHWHHVSAPGKQPWLRAVPVMLALFATVGSGMAYAIHVPPMPVPTNLHGFPWAGSDSKETVERLSKKNCKALGIDDGKCAIRVRKAKAAEPAEDVPTNRNCSLDIPCNMSIDPNDQWATGK